MTETFVYESYYIAVYHVFSLFLLVFINTAIYLKTNRNQLLSSFFILQGILISWIISKIFKTFAPNATIKFLFVVWQYAGVCFIGTAFIVFSYIYTNGVKPNKKLILPLFIISALLLLTVATNPLHYLFYTHFDFWGDSFGPLFYLQQGFNFLLFVIGTILCGKNFLTHLSSKKHIQTVLLTFGIVIPMIANILYVFRFFKKIFGFSPPFDITPISASISLILFALATFKFDFFDKLKLSRRVALSNVQEGILAITGDRIADFNETFVIMKDNGRLISASKESIVRPAGNIPYFYNYQKVHIAFDMHMPQDFIYKTRDDYYIRLICQPVKSKSFSGAFIRFIDITEKQAILKKLQMRNNELQSINRQLRIQTEMKKKLIVVKTRNYIAQETHDILGHSIILAISLLEIARISSKMSQKIEYINRAKKILSNSLNDLDSITSEETKNLSISQGIKERLEKLADEFRSAFIAVEIHCYNLKQELNSFIEDTLFKLCREGITNALQHGKATKVDIILRNKNEVVELFIIDNGIGCKKVQKGMGLYGMEQRVSLLKGSFSCHPLYGNGFCIKADIPLN
jgi:signal transduction histidine kinase